MPARCPAIRHRTAACACPLEFAKKLYAETERGMLVVIADDTSNAPSWCIPGIVRPWDAYSGEPVSPSDSGDAMNQSLAAAP